jgi:hypothetical protein
MTRFSLKLIGRLHCTNCGYVFELPDRKASVQIECVQEFLTAA